MSSILRRITYHATLDQIEGGYIFNLYKGKRAVGKKIVVTDNEFLQIKQLIVKQEAEAAEG